MSAVPCVVAETPSMTWLLAAELPTFADALHPAGEAGPVALGNLREALSTAAGRLRRSTRKRSAMSAIVDAPPAGLTEWSHGMFESMRASDREYGTHYEDTIRAFLAEDCSVTRTARVLHLHPNSVRHRLGRVRALTGADPLRFADQVELALALAICDS